MVEGNASVLTSSQGASVNPFSISSAAYSLCWPYLGPCIMVRDAVSWVGCSHPCRDSVSYKMWDEASAAPILWARFCHIAYISLTIAWCLQLCTAFFVFSSPTAESQWWSRRHSHEKCPCACILSPTSREGPNHEGKLSLHTIPVQKGDME